MPYCSTCGTQNSETAKFCINCGAAMQNVTTEPKPIPPSTLPTQQLSIGSKVSFVAGDGKTYAGTVKEILGDQYKIKYDAFDFETWLNKSQFTVIGAGASSHVYTPPPQNINPQVTYTNTSASAATTSAPGMAIITHLGFWGSIIILIGFFTDWINPGYISGASVSGFTFIRYAGDILNAPNNEVAMFMMIAIAVIVLSAIICLLYVLGVGIGRGAFTFFKILPLLAIIGFIVYSVIKTKEGGGEFETDTSLSPWKLLGIGIYLTLAGSLVLAISRSRR